MGNAPAVSVLMAMYNAERHLREAVESILAQTFADFEFIIIDDGSTDASVAIMRSYRDPRIRLLVEPHRGLPGSLNHGLGAARGELIARMDADDISEPDRLARQVARLRAEPDLVLLGCRARYITEDGRFLGCMIGAACDRELRHVLLDCPFVHGSVMYPRAAVLAVGGYREAFLTCEDYDLWFRLSEIGLLGNTLLPLYRMRLHVGSKMASEGRAALTAQQSERWLQVAEGGRSRTALHGTVLHVFIELTRRLALQRLLRGRDALGYALANGAGPGPGGARRPAPVERSYLAWAQVLIWQEHLGLARRLVWRALKTRPKDRHAWALARQCYASRAGLRAARSLLRRAWAFFRR